MDVNVLISHLDARQQAALSAGADAFISKDETPRRVAERLLTPAARVPITMIPEGATLREQFLANDSLGG